MKIEVIILYILQVLFILLEAFAAYMVLKYLKMKPLGMQTVLDKVIQDAILSVVFDQILFVKLLIFSAWSNSSLKTNNILCNGESSDEVTFYLSYYCMKLF